MSHWHWIITGIIATIIYYCCHCGRYDHIVSIDAVFLVIEFIKMMPIGNVGTTTGIGNMCGRRTDTILIAWYLQFA